MRNRCTHGGTADEMCDLCITPQAPDQDGPDEFWWVFGYAFADKQEAIDWAAKFATPTPVVRYTKTIPRGCEYEGCDYELGAGWSCYGSCGNPSHER